MPSPKSINTLLINRMNLRTSVLMLVLCLFLFSCKKDDGPTTVILIDGPSDVIIGVNNELQLTATVNGAPAGTLVWTSSNGVAAEVDNNGLVTSKKHGVTTITATDGLTSAEYPLQVFNASGSSLPEFDADVVAFMRGLNIPGASFAVVRDGKLVMARGYGVADILTEEVVTPISLFRIADASKPITATAIMKLVDDGMLDLDEKMFNILQNKFPQVSEIDQRIVDISVRQLLNHSSGIDLFPQPMFNQGNIAFEQQVESPPSLDVILDWWSIQDLTTTPGTTFAYHNVNYVLLGRIIEAKSGMTYEEYVKANILDPIEVTAARIGGSLEQDRFLREVSYYTPFSANARSVFDTGDPLVRPAYGGIGHIQNMDSHGGWIASVVDLARFALATDGNPREPDIISSTSQQLMVEDSGEGFGSGWFIESGNWNHSGLMPGTMSLLYVNDNGTIIVALMNSTIDPSDPLFSNVFNFFRDDLREAAESAEWIDQDLFSEF